MTDRGPAQPSPAIPRQAAGAERPSVSETVEVTGHLMDTGVLARVLDDVIQSGADYSIAKLDVGRTHDDESTCEIEVRTDDSELLSRLLMRLQSHGANAVEPGTAVTRPAPRDGVFPDDFYSTTNLETVVRLESAWVPVEQPEMDCGLLVSGSRVRTIPVSDVREGDPIVCGASGVRVVLPPREHSAHGVRTGPEMFGFMSSAVSTEKPQALQVRRIASRIRDVKGDGGKVLWVGGPAIVHTGAGPALVALIEAGFVDVLFAGNALATHDIEAALFGASLGVEFIAGRGLEHGHEHHIRAINTIRREGSIAKAVESGVLAGGIMHALVSANKRFVLVGSVRDDGPLPDVYTDVIDGQRAMRAALPGVGLTIMAATMLHSIATGNLLPASVPLISVDINPATVTKLADRGSAHAIGMVTDIGLFLEQLAGELVPGYADR